MRGISGVYNTCQAAELVISGALDLTSFLKLVDVYTERQVAKNSGVDEFSRVFELLKTRKQQKVRFNPPQFALADKLLFRDEFRFQNIDFPIKIYSLSPSDATVLQAKLAFAKELPQDGKDPGRVNSPSPNHSSVVLWAEIGQHIILLGADLERTSNPETGWSVILVESNVTSGKATLFKIPHHGSENAHHDGVWSQLLTAQPIAILSPFSHGKTLLPSETDINRIASLTNQAYLTTPAREKWRRGIVRDLVNDMTKSMVSANMGWGHVRLRRSITNITEPWEVILRGNACHIASHE